MGRPLKVNEVPVAPFDLREVGPISVEAAEKKLGRPFRIAPGAKVDLRATIDPRPCPECGGTVEWAATSRRTAKGLERYVFARCRKNQAHRWGFRAPHENGDVEVTHAPSLTAAIDAQLSELEEKKKKLEEMRAGAQVERLT